MSFEENQKRQVEARLNWAQRIEQLTLQHPNAIYTWEEAREAIQAADGVLASELYGGQPIDLRPQTGLVPIGMNPVTQLWEFYHLRSAWDSESGQDPAEIAIPDHAEDGTIEIQDEAGIVFVLIPGGKFLMGAQASDPDGPNYEALAHSSVTTPVHEVALDAYFLARHELTAGQWFRLSRGGEPSWHKRGSLYESDPERIGWTHPVNQVSWETCVQELSKHGLLLPTEAQWEYGARAGSVTAWWAGSEASALTGAANLLDLRAETAYPEWGRQDGDFDDGYAVLAPVDRFRFNPFGLLNVYGNVMEWCRDEWQPYQVRVREGDGLRGSLENGARFRVWRGGSFQHPARDASSSSRDGSASNTANRDVGLRPARSLRH